VTEPSSSDQKLSLLAAVLAFFLCVLWGVNTVAIKISLSGLGAFTAATLRFGIATLFLYFWAKITGQPMVPRAGERQALFINSLLFTVQLSLVYIGFALTHASRGALITNLQPFFLLFLSHVFIPGDRVTALKLMGLIVGFGGAACVFLDREGVSGDAITGDLILLAATMFWAAGAIYVKRILATIPSFHIVFYQMLFSVPFFALGALLWDAPMVVRLDAEIMAVLVFQGLVTTSFAFVVWTRMMHRYGAVALHSFVFLIPVSGVLLAGVLLDEPITRMILTALLLIAGGIVLVQLGQRRELAALRPTSTE
jgi:drug/metabolite transporter (DMT)-like permease